MSPSEQARRSPTLPAKTLRTILQHVEAEGIGHGADGGVVGGQAEEVDGYDHPRAQRALGQHGLHGLLQTGSGEVEGGGVDVDKDGGGAHGGYHLGRGEEGEVGHEHGIARPYAPHLQCQQQGVGAVGTSEAMGGAHVGGQRLLKFAHLGALYVMCVSGYLQQGLVNVGAQGLVLSG